MKASECRGCNCGAQAVAFLPCIDHDIPSHPYCRKCLDEEEMKAMIAILGKEEGKKTFNLHKNESK